MKMMEQEEEPNPLNRQSGDVVVAVLEGGRGGVAARLGELGEEGW